MILVDLDSTEHRRVGLWENVLVADASRFHCLQIGLSLLKESLLLSQVVLEPSVVVDELHLSIEALVGLSHLIS